MWRTGMQGGSKLRSKDCCSRSSLSIAFLSLRSMVAGTYFRAGGMFGFMPGMALEIANIQTNREAVVVKF